MEKVNMYIPLTEDEIIPTNVKEEIEARINNYNSERSTEAYDIVDVGVHSLGQYANEYQVYEFARAMAVLELAREGRLAYRVWGLSADIAFNNGDLEICREFVTREIKESSKSDVANSNKAYIPLSKESADENVADIMGMITDELGELTEDDYEKLLKDLAAPLDQWRNLEVPKWQDKNAYNIVYEILRLCYEHKAYRTALRLSGLLYVADERKKMPNLVKTNILVGKIAYELGYMETARRCFLFADRDTSRKKREPFPEEYRAFLEQETKLEITDEVLEKQKFIDDGIASGKFKTYTLEEVHQYYDGELEIEFLDSEKKDKERKKLGEKAVNAYEKHADGDAEERLKGIDAAFKVFTEEPEVYEEAAYLYFLKANIYLDKDDLENAYACIKKAYGCKNGTRNGMVLLCTAIILGRMGRNKEATVYVFRGHILCGEEFVSEKLGESAIEALENYLD
ncbi:MAG: hypothetical protein K2N06_04420 [Oscillospiraceae bacterium]|nr:hypothetical protein [Oscillospiraceae bacterium]